MMWNAPEIAVTLSDTTQVGTVARMDVVAAREQPVATAYLELSNVRFEWNDGAKDGDALGIQWGWRGEELLPLFTGSVLRAHLRETLQIWGLCKARILADTRVSRTYQNEAADAILRHLVGECGIDTQDIVPCPTLLDKLPLHDNSVLEALSFLDRRLELGRAIYCDAEGGFRWEEENTDQEAAFTFTHGEDVSEWKALPGGRFLLTTIATPVWHSQVVAVVDEEGECARYYVEQVRHTLGILGEGARSQFWLRSLSDG